MSLQRRGDGGSSNPGKVQTSPAVCQGCKRMPGKRVQEAKEGGLVQRQHRAPELRAGVFTASASEAPGEVSRTGKAGEVGGGGCTARC